MDGVLRKHLREQIHKHAYKRVHRTHVEFCSRCGKTYERTGRRDRSLCQPCSRTREDK
jgi:tRNA(Ile2) C34 agmatinyltransferase TiaS